ncbi:MAG TPA: ATP-binding cassette domain-containing protein, partial [Edaphobacter sp.]|nr:ATP-binding cassette domain-containing protein [Edaphobacter sp.]
FFAQDQYKVLDPNAGMLDDISAASPKVPVVELRSLLGCFMFSGDDVFKKLGVLSGGERNRYAMAKMLVSPSNMLLLDEPTNHLDLRAKDVLLDAIRNFTGTVLFVSHDRYFIDGLATRVFEVEDRRLHIYPGNYEDYLWRKQGGPEKVTEQITNSLATNNSPGAPSFAPSAKDGRAESSSAGTPHIDSDVWASSEARPLSSEPEQVPATPIKRLNPIKLKQLEDRLHHAEQEIPRLESAIAATEARLGNFTSAEQSQKDAAELETLRTKRTTLLAEWEELSLTLEEQQLA